MSRRKPVHTPEQAADFAAKRKAWFANWSKEDDEADNQPAADQAKEIADYLRLVEPRADRLRRLHLSAQRRADALRDTYEELYTSVGLKPPPLPKGTRKAGRSKRDPQDDTLLACLVRDLIADRIGLGLKYEEVFSLAARLWGGSEAAMKQAYLRELRRVRALPTTMRRGWSG